MELIQLSSFYQIVNTGSFSEAAKYVLRSQSTISHQIKNLEEDLGVKLFDRLGKKLMLTKEGKILFGSISYFFNDLENLKKIFEDMQHAKTGTLTLAANGVTMRYLLPNCIRKLDKKFPKIKLEIIHCPNTSNLIPLVLKGDVELGISTKFDQELPEKMEFLSWKTFDKILLMPKNHPLSKKESIALGDIASYPLVVYRKGTRMRKLIEEVFIRENIPFEIKIEMDGTENIKKYVEMNIGIAIVASLIVTKKDKDKFHSFNVSNIFGKIDYGIYFRKDKYITTAMKEFVKILTPELSNKLYSLVEIRFLKK